MIRIAHLSMIAFFVAILSTATAAETTSSVQPPYKIPYPSNVVPPKAAGPLACKNNFYPAQALAAHAEGATTLSFIVTKTGMVQDIKIVQSSGNQALDDAAVACVLPWTFQPATQDGEPVEVEKQIQRTWILNR